MAYSKHIRIIGIVGTLTILSLGSCTAELDYDRVSTPTDSICFWAEGSPISASVTTKTSSGHLLREVEEWPLQAADSSETKVAPTSSLSGITAGLIGFTYAGAWSDSNSPWGSMNSVAYNYVEARNMLTTAAPVKWSTIPGAAEYLRVYAYAPMAFVDGAKATLAHATGVPTITYTVPNDGGTADYTEQADLLSAVNTVAADYKEGIPLNFKHALTGIQFKLGFAATVKSISISGVYKKGTYKLGDFESTAWTPVITEPFGADDVDTYTISFNGGAGTAFDADAMITGAGSTLGEASTLMLIPQTLPEGATVELVYNDGADHAISASIAGNTWQPNKLVTYTIYRDESPTYIYFDLAAGNINITPTTYSGYVYKDGEAATVQAVTGTHLSTNEYYVYQSSTIQYIGEDSENPNAGYYKTTGFKSGVNLVGGTFDGKATNTCPITLPAYSEVTAPDGTTLWKDYITNAPARGLTVENIIEAWPARAAAVGRECTRAADVANGTLTSGRIFNQEYRILLTGNIGVCNLTIDNLYSRYHQYSDNGSHPDRRGNEGAIQYDAHGLTGNHVNIFFIGDNRLGNISYRSTEKNANEMSFSGTGSLTLADSDGTNSLNAGRYNANYWGAAIGPANTNDIGSSSDPAYYDLYRLNRAAYGLRFHRGVIFAGTTGYDLAGAIGGGGNGNTDIVIDGGTITAVCGSNGAALGGGYGSVVGGKGEVTILDGNVYAYNHNYSTPGSTKVPSAAIGGGCAGGDGSLGNITISGGNVYAETEVGAAIGGGSSSGRYGGDANVTITGGNIIAKSLPYLTEGEEGYKPAGCAIGGGTGSSNGGSSGTYTGGNAIIRISGGNLITGSIGGGPTADEGANIGSADVLITGGNIQAQFVMAAGAATPPSFTMEEGSIDNSGLLPAQGFNKVQPQGGAVFIGAGLNPGSFTMTGGTIKNSSANLGGAVYMGAGTFNMSGGTVDNCSAPSGGAVYIANEGTPTFTMSGSATISNSKATTGNGGALYMAAGTVSMQSSATINKCSAALDGGAIYVASGTMNMEGGTIQRSQSSTGNGGAVALTGGTVNMTGGTITGNTADRKGGGVYVNDGTFAMSNGSITGNASKGEGGGVAVSSGANLTINITGGATITGNTTQEKGGGISVQPTGSNTVEINIGTENDPSITNPDISSNGAIKGGGGIYVSGSTSTINLYSGRVKENSVSANVSNEDVENTDGVVNLYDSDVNDVMVIYHRNDGSTPDKTQNQRVLKGAKSTLHCPGSMFTHPGGKTFSRWTANADGTGKVYSNLELVTITSTLNIYAQWND